MKAALATRPTEEVNAQLALLAQLARNNTDPRQPSQLSAYIQIEIFNGFMLDTRVTLTYYCMMGLFIYLMVCFKSYFS